MSDFASEIDIVNLSSIKNSDRHVLLLKIVSNYCLER